MQRAPTTQVSVAGGVRGHGGPDEKRRGGCARGGRARPHLATAHSATLTRVEARPLGLGVVLPRHHSATG